jgi:hypothetical protein
VATSQSLDYVLIVEETTKVLRVSFNFPHFEAATKIKPGVSTGIKGDTDFLAPSQARNRVSVSPDNTKLAMVPTT